MRRSRALALTATVLLLVVALGACTATQPRFAGMVALGAMVVIAAALVAICVRRKDYRPLANVVIALGIWLFVTAGTLALARNALAEKLTQQGGDNALQSALRDLGAAITNDIMVQLAIISVVTLVVGIVARIVIGKAQGKRTYSVKRANT